MPTVKNSYTLEMELIRQRANNEDLTRTNLKLLQEKADVIHEINTLQRENFHLEEKIMDLERTFKSFIESIKIILPSCINIQKYINDKYFVIPENELPNAEINLEHSSSVQPPIANGTFTSPVVIRDLQIILTNILNHAGMQSLNNTTKNDDPQSECSNANEEPTNSTIKATNQETKDNLTYKKRKKGNKE